MKRILMMSMMILLTACFYDKDAKQLKNSETTQTEIKTAIQNQAKETYGMDVEVDMDKLSFSYPEGKLMLPLKTSKRLEVPVTVTGDPAYDFKAYMSIYDEQAETYTFDEQEIDLSALPYMATELLTDIFKKLYEKQLNDIEAFDAGLIMNVSVEDRFSNLYFEDEAEETTLIMDFAVDYNEGRFTDHASFKSLIKKHAALPNKHSKYYEEQLQGNQPCTPNIHLKVEHQNDEDQSTKERFEALAEYVNNDDDLPNGEYFIQVAEADPENDYDQESYSELVLKCNH